MNHRDVYQLCLSVDEVVMAPNSIVDTYFIEEQQLVINYGLCARIYAECCEDIFRYRAGETNPNILQTATVATIINGEFHTAWNVKLEILNTLNLEQELHVSCMSLMIHRKSSIGWYYVYNLLKKDNTLIESFKLKFQVLIERHPRNYYAWMYMFKIFQEILTPNYKLQEYTNTLKFCQTHLKDSSSFHYLLLIAQNLNLLQELYTWTMDICNTYYGSNGLYIEQNPPGYENFHILLRTLRTLKISSDVQLTSYKALQHKLGRLELISKYL